MTINVVGTAAMGLMPLGKTKGIRKSLLHQRGFAVHRIQCRAIQKTHLSEGAVNNL